jgi:hypothetical protein
MRKKGHLSLVETPAYQSSRQSGNSSATSDRSTGKIPSVQQRLTDAEQELSAMQDVIRAAMFMLRSLPLDKLTMQELCQIHEIFADGENVLDVYEMELHNLSGARMSNTDIRKYTKARNIMKRLRSTMPEAKEFIADAIVRQSGKTEKTKADRQKKSAGKKAEPNGIQLKVSLRGSKPPIWRRLLVPGNCTLTELHFTIQQSMGWSDRHLHGFYIKGVTESLEPESCDEDTTTLADFNLSKGSRFVYEYDFGDSWIHTIEVEKILEAPHHVLECTGGKRACPPEDCGGIEGFYENLEILKNPDHPEYEDVRRWMGDFDPS